tara:strand:- start:9939 stop:10526 length:588 start_codon:yes stop_codon:yes gene_type:complete
MTRCTCHDVLIVKNLNRWFKEKWVDVSRKDKDGKHPPCGRSKAKLSGKGYPKCRPSVKVSSDTPKTSGSMSSGQKQAATKRKRAKKQGVGGKPTIVKTDYAMRSDMSAFSAAWDILKASTERKKLSLNRRPNTGPISFTNERQKTREQRMIQDMINETGNEQPRDVMNQKGREQNPQEEENQYQHMLEDFQYEGY